MKKSLFLVLALLLLGMTSGELFISQNNAVYSKGDTLNLSVTVSGTDSVPHFLIVNLNCGDQKQLIGMQSLNLGLNEQKKIDLQVSLESSIVNSLEGSCFVNAEYGNQVFTGTPFQVSSEVILSYSGVGGIYSPNELINVTGTAYKKNGQGIDGSIEVTSDFGLDFVQQVQAGKFSFSFSVPEHAKAKDYGISLSAYDQDHSGNISNKGVVNTSIKVKQVLTSIDIAIGDSEVSPGENLSYSVVGLDQAGDYMNTEANVIINTPYGDKLVDRDVVTSQSNEFVVVGNYTPGDWSITANANGISKVKNFKVLEYKHFSYILQGDKLIIVNDGNVPNSDLVQVNVGNETLLKQVDLESGSQLEFVLRAPDGDYPITIGKENVNLGRAFLTGNAVALSDPNSSNINWMNVLWIIILLGLGFGIWYYYERFSKHHYSSSMNQKSISGNEGLKQVNVMENGRRERAAMVILKIRNASILTGNQQFAGVMSKLSDKAKEQRAYIARGGDIMTVVFSPTLMGSGDLNLAAAEFAGNAAKEFDEYNKKFTPQVDYGIGVNEGEIAVEYKSGMFKYASIANTLAVTRKLADVAKKEALISTNMHALTRARVKVERGVEGWRITSMKDSGKYEDFIAKFKQRQTKPGFYSGN